MSVLIYTESSEGKFKKTAFEIASYAKKIADTFGTTVTALTINASETSSLATYGVSKVVNVTHADLNTFHARAYADVIKQVATKEQAKVIIFASTTDSLHIAPLVAVGLDAGFASNVIALPESTSPFQV